MSLHQVVNVHPVHLGLGVAKPETEETPLHIDRSKCTDTIYNIHVTSPSYYYIKYGNMDILNGCMYRIEKKGEVILANCRVKWLNFLAPLYFRMVCHWL